VNSGIEGTFEREIGDITEADEVAADNGD